MVHDLYTLKVLEVVRRAADTASIVVEKPPAFSYVPGQFVMLWLPGVNEKPFALSHIGPDYLEATIREIGPFTRDLTALSPGDLLGVRGPFGNGFTQPPGTQDIIVAGGIGIASVSYLKTLYDIPLFYGARSKQDVLFARRFPAMRLATDDGSAGFPGLVTQLVARSLADLQARSVYACGPEPMLVGLLQLCREHNLQLFASVERYMKCGVGICGQCTIDDRVTCVDGPVFDRSVLDCLREFGNMKYNAAGAPVDI